MPSHEAVNGGSAASTQGLEERRRQGMAKIYGDSDCDLGALSKKTIAAIGYGSQGHAHAQNMRDSGLKVIVADVPDSPNWKRAAADGFEVFETQEAAQKADVLLIALPDTIQKKVYESAIAPHMKAGKALVFFHGFNIHFGLITPPKEVDVYMVAPKGPGHLVRRQFREGKGVPCLVAVHQDASGNALAMALAHAKAIGASRAGIIETTFAEETETDLFGEQVVLCGGCTSLVKAGFETLVEAGYQPEIAYFECLHELKLIVDLMYESGIAGMRYSISDTAEYGDLTRGPRIINEATRAEMKKILEEIRSGAFAKEWVAEYEAGCPNFNRLREKDRDHLIEKVGKRLRSMMSWIKEAVRED